MELRPEALEGLARPALPSSSPSDLSSASTSTLTDLLAAKASRCFRAALVRRFMRCSSASRWYVVATSCVMRSAVPKAVLPTSSRASGMCASSCQCLAFSITSWLLRSALRLSVMTATTRFSTNSEPNVTRHTK